jgi:hypothetical protein
MTDFISEDDLDTFEGWLKGVQGIDPTTAAPDMLEQYQAMFDEISKSSRLKVGLMKLSPLPGKHLYAVAVREGSDLWLTLWVRRSKKGEVFIMVPRADRGWDPHASYHLDGTFHSKSFGHKHGTQQRQPLNTLRGTEHLGTHAGHGPKRIGAVCDPAVFSGVVEVPPGVLGPMDGAVAVDLVEPGSAPIAWPFGGGRIVQHGNFKERVPWLVLRVGTT